jgi:N-methylhydantoinase B/oxoprolinase/acetone carboxylase alpha subunit
VQVTIDFTGSDPQVQGAVNAVEAITYSACFYVFRCLLREDVPATSGLMRPIRVIAPAGTVVNAKPPAAVAGGNVETSQRIVDVLLKALAQAIPDRIPAAASGTMNNLTIGGIDRSSFWRPSRRAIHLLRNHRRRHGRASDQRRSIRRPHPHDQLSQHSRRGA